MILQIALAQLVELEPNTKIWTVPADRWKQERTQGVLLFQRAAKDLADTEDLRCFYGTVFSSLESNTLSEMALLNLMIVLAFDAESGGFCISFRTWTQE